MQKFGRLLHPVQDFYAHTNWIEQGRADIFENSVFFFPLSKIALASSVSRLLETSDAIINLLCGEMIVQILDIGSDNFDIQK